MRIRLDQGKCAGHALCHAVDPDDFPIDDDGYSTLAEHDVQGDRLSVVRDGVAVCPELALVLDGDG